MNVLALCKNQRSVQPGDIEDRRDVRHETVQRDIWWGLVGHASRAWRFLTGFQGYLLLGTDELPSWGKPGPIQYSYTPTGEPTVGSALLRIIMVIPHAIVLGLVGIGALILALAAAIMVLLNEAVGNDIWKFQMGVVAWQARVLSYYLSLVEEYPPFSLELNAFVEENEEASD